MHLFLVFFCCCCCVNAANCGRIMLSIVEGGHLGSICGAFFNLIRFSFQDLQSRHSCNYQAHKATFRNTFTQQTGGKTHYLAKKSKEARVWKISLNTPSGNIHYFHFQQQLPGPVFTFIEYLAASIWNTESYILFHSLLLLFFNSTVKMYEE